ncbi:MAG TPA: metallopeptidase family protein [Xanthobacteraceae bacterium]|nr:metallopeptidase family protein [Xanthobacteraceae bacterium]
MPDTPSHPDCRNLFAPRLEDIEAIAREEFARLPETFRALCADVVFRVEDFPSEEVLARMGIEDAFELLGLFEGVGLPFRSHTDVTAMPNMIWLYRRPILDYWCEHEETLGAIVSHVLIHEIGHHFGFSDADMEAIEARVG